MTSPQDFERLSAYLDHQLSPKEKAGLEARLAHDAELETALDEMRQTVRALRSLPVVKPPRNFTLSPQQAGVRAPSRPVFGALRLATAVAAAGLVLAFVGNLVTSPAPGFRPLAAAPVPMVVSRSSAPATALPPSLPVAAAAPTEAPAQAVAVAQNAGPTTEDMTHQGGAGGPLATEAAGKGAPAPALGAAPGGGTPQAGLTFASPAQPSASGAISAPVETSQPQALMALAAPTTTTVPAVPVPRTAITEPVTAPEAYPALGSSTAESEALTISAGQAPASSAAPAVEVPSALPPEASSPLSGVPWRALEIGLAALTLILGAAAWLTRRR